MDAEGIINLIKAPFIPEASGGKAGGTSSYKRRLAGQRLLPLVGRTQIKTLCGRMGKKKHPWDRFFSLGVCRKPEVQYKTCDFTPLGLSYLTCEGCDFLLSVLQPTFSAERGREECAV